MLAKLWQEYERLPTSYRVSEWYTKVEEQLIKKTSSPVNILPNSLRAKLSGLASSSTKVSIKLTGASHMPKGCTINDFMYPPSPLILTL